MNRFVRQSLCALLATATALQPLLAHAAFEQRVAVPQLTVESSPASSGSTTGSPGSSTGGSTTTGGSAGGSTDGSTGGSTGGTTAPSLPSTPLTLSASELSVGLVSLGQTSAPASLVVTNGGSVAANAVHVSVSEPFAATHNCPATLAAGASCTVNVTGTPSTVYAYRGDLAVTTSNGSEATATLYMTGAGGRARWTPIALDFGPVPLGSSATKTADLSNQGTTTVNYSSLTGLPPSMTANASACASVAPGGHCTVSVTFTPTVAGGVSATGIKPSSATSSAYIVNTLAVTGTGDALRNLMDLSTYLVDFQSVPLGTQSSTQTVAFLNTGDVALTTPTLTVSGPFQASHNCPASLPAGGTCTISVQAAPTAAGWTQGELVVESPADNSPLKVALRVTGTGSVARWATSSVDFGSVPTGSSVVRTVTLFNDGTSTADYHTLRGLPASVTASTSGCAAVAGGSSCVVTLTYAPSAEGPMSAFGIKPSVSGTGVLYDNTLGVTGLATAPQRLMDLSAQSLAFGLVNINTTSAAKNVLLLSTGDSAISALAIATTGPFSATHNCPAAVAAGTNCTISVTATPTTAAGVSGTLTVSTDASNAPMTVSLTATGAGTYARWSAPSVDFGTVVLGQSATATATLFNDGTVTANFSNLQNLPAGVTSNSASCAAVTAGTGCVVTFTFAPTAVGYVSGTAVLPVVNGAPVSHSNTLSISGTGGQGTFDVSTVNLSGFVANTGGTSASKSFIVYNTGTLPVTLSSVSFGSGAPYSVSSNDCTMPVALTAQGCTFNVTFQPTAAGTNQSATATVTTSVGTKQVALAGGDAYNLTLNGTLVGSASGANIVAAANVLSKPLIVSPATVQLKSGSSVMATSTGASWDAVNGYLSVTFGTLPAMGTYDFVVLDTSNKQLAKQSVVLADPGNLSGQALKLEFESSVLSADTGAYGLPLTTYGTPTFNTTSARSGLKSASVTSGHFIAAPHAALGFGTGDFTMEAWVNLTGYNSNNTLFLDMRVAGYNESKATVYAGADGKPHFYVNQTERIIATSAIPLNTWAHLAVSRNSGTTRLYLNGVLQGSWVDATNYGTSAPLAIGGYYPTPTGTTNRVLGSIDDVIITKGTGKYPAAFSITKATQTTSATSLTVPSTAFGTTSAPALATVTNTGSVNLNVLTASVTTNSTEFTLVNNCTTPIVPGASCTIGATFTPGVKEGSSTGAVTFTTDGVTASQVVSFTATSTASTAYQVNFDDAANPTADVSGNNNVTTFVSRNGTPSRVTTQAAGGAASAYPAAGGYISVASSRSFGYGTGDFTVQFWVNSSDYRPLWGGQTLWVQNNLSLWLDGSGMPCLATAGTQRFCGTTAQPLNQWVHFAITKASGTIRVFMNGTLVNSYADSATNYGTTSPAYMSDPSGSLSQTRINGYIDDVTVTSGKALWTTNFTPARPTATLSKTDLVMPDTNAGAVSTASSLTITNNGTAPLSVLSATATTNFTVTSNTCSANIAVGGSCTIGVSFAPAASGAKTGTLTLVTNTQTPSQTVGLYGTALSASGGDPYWANVVALLHGDGAEGGQVFTDSKGVRTWSVGGTGTVIKTTAASSKFGGSSIYASGGQYIRTNTAIALGTGDFTIEFWAQRTGAGGVGSINPPVYSDGWAMATTHGGYTEPGFNLINWAHCNANGWNCVSWNTSIGAGSGSVTANPYANWNYVAISKSGSTVRLYVNGILYNTLVYNPVYTMDSTTNLVTIGGNTWSGYIDELRITTVGRYTSPSIPVPTAPFPNN